VIKFSSKLSIFGLLIVLGMIITASISSLIIGALKLFNFGSSICLEIYPYPLDFCSLLKHKSFSYSMLCLWISAASVGISLCSSLISVIFIFVLFLLVSLAKGLSMLFICLKNQLFVSLFLYVVHFVFISLISTQVDIISFFLLILRLAYSCFSMP
jgi:hypothetical protein